MASSFDMRPCGMRETGRRIVHKALSYCNLLGCSYPLEGRLALRILPQQRHELAARHLAGAQARQVRTGHLAVDDLDVARATLLDQARQCHLRGIAFQTEHGLAEENLSQLDPVETSDQLRFTIGLNRVPESEL